MKNQLLEQDLKSDKERVCVECETFQIRITWIEVRCEALVEELTDELCRAAFVKQEEEYFEADDANNKINDEHELDATEESFDECNSESELEYDRYLLWIVFDGWMYCVCHARREFN